MWLIRAAALFLSTAPNATPSQVAQKLIEWAKTSGVVTKINLRVRTDNPRAIALYERKGFTFEGTIRRELLIDGVYYDHHLMGLVL